MKTLAVLLLVVLAAGARPARAQVSSDGPILSMIYAENKVYHTFMQLQFVQELATLKSNYDASVRYFQDFKQLNSGPGFLANVGGQLKAAQSQEDQSIQRQLTQQFIAPSTGRNTVPDTLLSTLDQVISSNIKYAGDELSNAIADRQQGVAVAQDAQGLAPKDAANLSAKAQGLQLQMLASIHEDDLRMLQLQSVMLSRETQRQEEESSMIHSIQGSLQERGVPTAGGQ
ncbi:MAG: hypothetical protein KGL53_01550 [Elusimicrobia bacterium]|nr:hypothetical protein [Elusimicrobiota bacterium]